MARTTALPTISSEGGLARYLQQIRQFPMLQPDEEYMLAKRWKEHGDRDAAHQLVTSHLRLVAKIAMGYRGYGLPISEVISEGNVGLMQAVKRFEPDKGFRLATYAMWWIKASIQEFILRSWSLVKMGTTASQKKLFFNLRKVKGQIQALEEGDLRPDQVTEIAKRLGVPEEDVISMNRRLSGDASLNAPVRAESEGEWQDWLVDQTDDQESALVESEEAKLRMELLSEAMEKLTLVSGAFSRPAGCRKSRRPSKNCRRNSACRASEFVRSRCVRSRRCRKPSKTLRSESWRRRRSQAPFTHEQPAVARVTAITCQL